MFEKLNVLKSSDYLLAPDTSPYITCNEQEQQQTLRHLSKQVDAEPHENHLHVGFSVWFNLDIICTTRPDFAVIFDIDPAVCDFIYPLLNSTISSSASREEFIAQFILKLNDYESVAPLADYLKEEFRLLMESSYGFLANEDNFNYLKDRLTEEQIFFGNLNMADQPRMLIIQEWIAEKKLKLETLYLSNIPEWLTANSKKAWQEAKNNISELLQPSTLLIDAFYPTTQKNGSGPPQRISKGILLDYTVKRAAKKSIDRPGRIMHAPADLAFAIPPSQPPIPTKKRKADKEPSREVLENKKNKQSHGNFLFPPLVKKSEPEVNANDPNPSISFL